MEYDPILKEVHATKERIAREANYDVHQLAERLKKDQERYRERLVQSVHTDDARDAKTV